MDRDQVRHYLYELQSLMNKGNVSISISPNMDMDYSNVYVRNIKEAVSEAINLLSDQKRDDDLKSFVLKRIDFNESSIFGIKSDIDDCNRAIRRIRNTVAFLIGSGIGVLIFRIVNVLIQK